MSHFHLATATSSSNFQPIINNALKAYERRTGKNLLVHPLFSQLRACNSPASIVAVLQRQLQGLDRFRSGDGRWTKWLDPTIKVLYTFSAMLEGPVGLPQNMKFAEICTLIYIWQVFSPARAIFAGVGVLLSAAKDVRGGQDALFDVFECIESFFQRLEIYTEVPPTTEMRETIIQIMAEVLSILGIMTMELKQGRMKNMIGKTDLEDTLKRLDKLTNEEARMAARVLRTNDRVDAMVTDGDKLGRDVQLWLSPPDPSTNHDFLRKARHWHSDTAPWFFESNSFTEWTERGSLLWIHGKPGAGKSTLLFTIIEDIEGMHAAGLATMAYYYFDFMDVKKHDCYGLLSSLISQLSAKSDSWFDILSQLYSNHSGIRKPTIGALKKCMIDMLRLPGKSPIYIIIDGLDECPNFPRRTSAREEVLRLVKNFVDLKVPNVHLCVASRPEMDIRMVLEPLTPLKVSLHDESGQQEDIIAYIKSVVRSDWGTRRWEEEDKQLAIDILSDKADGQFRWVVCQVDRLCRSLPSGIRHVLADIPKALDETYGPSLLRIDEDRREEALRLFQCLSVSIRPLRVEELAEVLAVRFDKASLPMLDAAWRPENAEVAVLSVCSSLIAIVDGEHGQVVKFSHFSVKDFLTSDRLATADERLSYYHILPEPAHTALAHACLSVLLQLDDKINKDTIDHFPLAPYAAQHWADHARLEGVSRNVEDQMKLLIDPRKSHLAICVWIHDPEDPMRRRTIRPETPLPLTGTSLHYAALWGLHFILEFLILEHSQDVNSRGLIDNATPLHLASKHGQLKAARLLIELGADVSVQNKDGETPLHLALTRGQREVACMLIDRGADVTAQNSDGETPLHLALFFGEVEAHRMLIERGAKVTVQNKYGLTPLHLASFWGQAEDIRFLIGPGADVAAPTKDGVTLLHMASQGGQVEVALMLIERSADATARNEDGETPLHWASQQGHPEVVRLLLEHGADGDARDNNNCTPLHWASQQGHLEVVRVLVANGINVNARDHTNWTALHGASQPGHLEVVHCLLEHGADANASDQGGWTSLQWPSYYGDLEIVQALLEHGVDVNTRDNSNWTPLHSASQQGHREVVRVLLEHGADANSHDDSEQTPLDLASRAGHLELVQLLVDSRANIDMRNDEGQTPLEEVVIGHM